MRDDDLHAVGAGAVDFPAVLAAASAAGVKHYFVEQDQSQGDPIAALRTSYRYVQGFQHALGRAKGASPMDKRTKGCLWIGLGVAIAGAMVWWRSWPASATGRISFAPDAPVRGPGQGRQQFAEIRARFADLTPLIDVDRAATPRGCSTEGRPAASPASCNRFTSRPTTRDAGKLVRFSVPFWLMRLGHDGKVSVGDGMLDDVRGAEKLTVKELEALGPGLLIDERKPDGDRVLVWTE